MNIGLIAHDSKKKLMQNFCIAYRGILCKHALYATGTTGRLIEEAANLNVYCIVVRSDARCNFEPFESVKICFVFQNVVNFRKSSMY